MKRTPVIVGLTLALLAGAAMTQARDHGRDESGPRGYPTPMGRDQPVYRSRDQGQPPHGPPPYGRWPPGPPPGGFDSLGAGWSAQQDAARAGVRQHHFVPLGSAIESIRRRGPGRELDAGLEQWEGRAAYRIRWADPDGRRIDYMVDAETGAILGVDEGR